MLVDPPDASVDQQPHPELTMELPSRIKSLEPPESRIMVNLEAIELVSNLDNVSKCTIIFILFSNRNLRNNKTKRTLVQERG